jgi:site-specific DNA-methyltransferase (adenine-specific)
MINYEDSLVTLHCGDCVEVMRGFDENSFDAIITDPPYGLEFMGKDWDKLNFHNSPDAKGGVKLGMDIRQPGDSNYTMNDTPRGRSKVRYSSAPSYMVKKGKDGQTGRIDGKGGMDTWGDRPKYVAGEQMEEWHYQWAVEALRVVKPGGYLLAFGGTRTFHRLACAIEDAGFEFRDTIMWVYGSGFPKSLDVSKAIDKNKGIEREVIGVAKGIGSNSEEGRYGWNSPNDRTDRRFYDETIPATPEAKEWEGWGTALKPAWEPILIFRKPVIGSMGQEL